MIPNYKMSRLEQIISQYVPNFKTQIAILPTTLRLAVGRDYAAVDKRDY